jgi:hypothetical protein
MLSKERVQVKSDSAPAEARSAYRQDIHAWARSQAELLKTGRLDEIDAINIAEEILDVGEREYDKFESALAIILLHMLKWDHQPERRSRSWQNSIAEHRRRAEKQLRKMPSLKTRTGEAVEEASRGRPVVVPHRNADSPSRFSLLMSLRLGRDHDPRLRPSG